MGEALKPLNGYFLEQQPIKLKDRFMRDNKPLTKQIDLLARFLLDNFPEEPGRYGDNEGAVDVAIRLLKQYHPDYVSYQRKLKELTKLILTVVKEGS